MSCCDDGLYDVTQQNCKWTVIVNIIIYAPLCKMECYVLLKCCEVIFERQA